MSYSICVLCPYGLDSGLLSKAVALSGDVPVRVLIPETDAKTAINAGATYIHTLAEPPASENNIVQWLKEKIALWNCTIVLAPADIKMRNLMPLLAYSLNAGLTADCTDLQLEGDQLIQTRPAFGNSLVATIRTTSDLQMATVRPGTFRYMPHTNTVPVIKKEQPVCSSHGTFIDFIPFADGTPLGQANIIIAGGQGIGSKEGFQKLEVLAEKLGGSVAASRNAVDAGYAPYRMQVGMTGVTVCPKLYIAIGISGAVQHLAGMSGSEKIIAINADPKAPIFDYADYGIVADWETGIDKLLEVL